MEKEYIRETKRTITLNVTGGKIDSFREIEKTTGTVRVYENGCIGIAGCLGEPDEAALTEKAKEALAFGVPYPCKLEGALELEEVHDAEILPVAEFIPTMQDFLDRLGALCPKFAFSNKIGLEYSRTEYRNSLGRRLVSAGRQFYVSLVAQSRGSGNMFDTFFGWSGDYFNADELLNEFKKEYDAFFRPVTLESGHYPVLSVPEELLSSFGRHFSGDLYAAGASLLSGKLGQPVFSDRLSVKDDRNPATAQTICCFDAEGCTAPDFRPELVENGVLKGLMTTKKTATQHGLPNLGSADAAYDGVPEPGLHRLWVEPTAKSLRELVPGKAVFAVVASGGDATPEGHFATPVQMAYLMENGELVGRLPELNISGEFFELFGKDYLGTVHDAPLPGTILSAFMMDVSI